MYGAWSEIWILVVAAMLTPAVVVGFHEWKRDRRERDIYRETRRNAHRTVSLERNR
jgi:hypothetical protein